MKGRNIGSVIDQMLAHVPDGEPLRERLQHLANSARYKAPEQMYEMWFVGTEILQEEFGPPEGLNEWQKAVVAIWIDKPAGVAV